AIEKEGAQAHVTDLNYDDTVRLATQTARENNWILMQDTSMPGYADIPGWIMQGYTTMVAEAIEQLQQARIEKPTHVMIQAGVGSMAAAVLGFLVEKFHADHPTAIIIEPENAACFYKSILAGDGQPHRVTGDLQTRMAGLACGEPNPVAWEILRDYADFFVVCPDFVTAEGMRRLAGPYGTDEKIVSGESGAVGIGLLELLMGKPELAKHKKALGLDKDAVVLAFSTEGDTDPEGYRQIVNRIQCPSPI
ncbi:MAG: diaminopropionate ammonia-lyase, partial [Desulfobacterales bacterium]|nr:diaminopropionate ammonia-lyase [Desulfobacterales bacterium]